MVASSSVLEDSSTLSQLDQKLHKLESFLALVTGLAVFSLMVLAVVSVSGRNFFGIPLPGYVDWIEQIMPLIAFMGVAYTQRDGGHIRMDILVGALKGRALWLAEIITTTLILALMLFLVWGTFSHFLRSFDFAAPLWSRDSSIDIALPIWPAKLLAPIAFSVLCLRLTLQLWGYCRAFAQNQTTPIAVPLVENAAQQAAREAQSVSGGAD
ncbi:MAG: TRAP transporter small permease [Alphaproteobacteria bacterium]|nr:TRAP transporter small permease [Alphaproteobacteria bacterium]